MLAISHVQNRTKIPMEIIYLFNGSIVNKNKNFIGHPLSYKYPMYKKIIVVDFNSGQENEAIIAGLCESGYECFVKFCYDHNRESNEHKAKISRMVITGVYGIYGIIADGNMTWHEPNCIMIQAKINDESEIPTVRNSILDDYKSGNSILLDLTDFKSNETKVDIFNTTIRNNDVLRSNLAILDRISENFAHMPVYIIFDVWLLDVLDKAISLNFGVVFERSFVSTGAILSRALNLSAGTYGAVIVDASNNLISVFTLSRQDIVCIINSRRITNSTLSIIPIEASEAPKYIDIGNIDFDVNGIGVKFTVPFNVKGTSFVDSREII